MYLRILLCVLIVLEGVLGRTPEDVIKDFEPAFQKTHNKFYEFGNNTKQQIEPMFKNVTLEISYEHNELNSFLTYVRVFIEQTVWEILGQLGMTNHVDLIPHCITNLNKSENTLIATALGGQRICVKYALEQVSIHTTFVEKLFTELNNEHYIVEVTREECGKLRDAFDVQECLIKDLYVYYPSYFDDVSKEIDSRVELVRENLKSAIEDLAKCDEFIRQGVAEDFDDALDEFQECAAESKPHY